MVLGEPVIKNYWVQIISYQNLPEDFKEKHPSVWVDVSIALFNPVRGHRFYNEYLDELEFADGPGVDDICVNEHHANAYGPDAVAQYYSGRTRPSNFQGRPYRAGQLDCAVHPPFVLPKKWACLTVSRMAVLRVVFQLAP